MHSANDLLGDEGRKAVDACVKVAIFGKPELQRYTRKQALERLWDCYGGKLPNPRNGKDLDPVILPERDVHGKQKEFYDIGDICRALDGFDKIKFVEIYGEDLNESEKICKHREDVTKERQNSLDAPVSYSVQVAQRRVRDCYAGNFPGDVLTHTKEEDLEGDRPYSIFDIRDALARYDKDVAVDKYPNEEHTQVEAESYLSALRESIDEQRKAVEEEYKEAIKECRTKQDLITYNAKQAQRRVKGCHKSFKKTNCKAVLRENLPKNGGPYLIFHIRDTCVQCEDLFTMQIISDPRKKVEEEYQKAISSCGQQRYSRDQAERKVRNCFVGSFPGDAAILPIKGNPPKERYLISDIVEAVDYYDQKILVDKYPAEWEMKSDERETKIAEVNKCRTDIEKEHEEGNTSKEIENGSGFIIHSHFIITSAHVVSDVIPNAHAVTDKKSDEGVFIYNQIIKSKLRCEVIHSEENNCIDLAILLCKDLDIKKIKPLQLSDQTPLPGMSIFSFGYPFFHTGEKALLATGYVSGSDEPFGQENILPLVVLNLPLNHGNSGGPLLHRVDNEVKVVGVVAKKQIKDILKPEEIMTICKIEESLQTSSITDLKDCKIKGAEKVREKGAKPDLCQTPLNLLTLKLYKALETHCQFVSSKAIPQETLRAFLVDCCPAADNYKKEHKEEWHQLKAMLQN